MICAATHRICIRLLSAKTQPATFQKLDEIGDAFSSLHFLDHVGLQTFRRNGSSSAQDARATGEHFDAV